MSPRKISQLLAADPKVANRQRAGWHYYAMAAFLAVCALVSTRTPAQEAPASGVAADPPSGVASNTTAPPVLQQIVVSGSRVITKVSDAPTPVTNLNLQFLQQVAPITIADALNALPQVDPNNTDTPANAANQVSTGTAGVNYLDLRFFGTERTLVLLDGRRVVPSDAEGDVDMNTLPTGLLQSVDVVMGGSSAAYGSGAVAGVVNFVLNTHFTGLKADISGGAAQNGAQQEEKGSITFGTAFAGGRGHFEINVAAAKSADVRYSQESWFNPREGIVTNPAYVKGNGQPEYIWTDQANYSASTPGGVIESGPDNGVAFGPNGQPYEFNFGETPTQGVNDIGGTTNIHDPSPDLWAPLSNQSVFSRIQYDLTPKTDAFAEFTYGQADVDEPQGIIQYNGAAITIQPNNPFIPPSVAATDGGQPFKFRSMYTELGRAGYSVDHRTLNGLVGVEGIAGQWHWNASYQYGSTRIDILGTNMYNKADLLLAANAVVDPANGGIVCASTLTDPTNGCVPLDVFGTNVASPAALNYLMGTAYSYGTLIQQDGELNVRGVPFSDWAGGVSLAAGVEARHDSIRSTVDPISLAQGWYTGNYQPTNGSDSVEEAYTEVLVPLASRLPGAYSLNLDGAVRETRYSVSGSVTSWKTGLVYAPFNDEFRIRASHSRDIRAPTLEDLYSGGIVTTANTYIDPATSTQYEVNTTSDIGNKTLVPELADTNEVGLVYSPGWARGFSASVDYFDISIANAIESISGQDIVDNCYAGEAQACSELTRSPVTGLLTHVYLGPLNYAKELERGIDIETDYERPLGELVPGWRGSLTARFLATDTLAHTLREGSVVTVYNGYPDLNPTWKVFGSLGYALGRVRVVGMARYISGGLLDLPYTPQNLVYDRIPQEAYVDLYGSYTFPAADHELQLYFKVSNILNRDPPDLGGIPYTTDPSVYDALGRVYEAGFRFEL
jgi:iron complex outermembrane recepter protein